MPYKDQGSRGLRGEGLTRSGPILGRGRIKRGEAYKEWVSKQWEGEG